MTQNSANPSASAPGAATSLADLRRDIDRIDEAMHRLLMQRGDIIDRLIATKRTQESGSAFRPAREADMMRRLVERHAGILPLDTVESIWRVIIATFTYVQAPFCVHADLTPGEAAMRDSARFHFGFTVPLLTHLGAGGVVAALGARKGDLGLVPAGAGAGAWWTLLEAPEAPKIIARLPFVERDDHPAALPVFAISHPAADAVVTDVEVWSVHATGWSAGAARALGTEIELIALPDSAPAGSSGSGAALLVSVPQDRGFEAVRALLAQAGASIRSAAPVGSHATRYRVLREGEPPVPTGR